MKIILTGAVLLHSALLFAAPTVVNQDQKRYSITVDCPGLSSGTSLEPEGKEVLKYEGPGCKLLIKDYKSMSVLSQTKLTRDAECWVKAGKVHCQ